MYIQAKTLIVATPSRIRESLRALLLSIPEIEVIDQVDDLPTAMQLIRMHHPALVLVEDKLIAQDRPASLAQLRSVYKNGQYIVLTNYPQQEQAMMAAGADAVLSVGASAVNFFETINQTLGRSV